jgi:hypothetical protein
VLVLSRCLCARNQFRITSRRKINYSWLRHRCAPFCHFHQMANANVREGNGAFIAIYEFWLLLTSSTDDIERACASSALPPNYWVRPLVHYKSSSTLWSTVDDRNSEQLLQLFVSSLPSQVSRTSVASLNSFIPPCGCRTSIGLF